MRHGTKFNHLGRKTAHRKMLLSNLACELISHKRIITTLAKAKALRVYAEPLLTKAKTNTTHQRRVVFSYLQDKDVIKELFSTVSEKIASRPGGYTRIIKLGKRLGDAAEMALIELVDFNETYTGKGSAAKASSKRTRRAGGSRKKATDSKPAATAAVAEETATVEENTPEAAVTEKTPVKEEKATASEENEEKSAE